MLHSNSRRSAIPLLLGVLACGVACVAVSNQSLWVDEAETALFASQPTLHGWWHALYAEHSSNLQLLLYMIYVWGWARVCGVTEIALRGANIPWFLIGFAAIFHFLRRRPGLRNAALLVYCIHPFVWYYLNEARPYMMQLSGGLLATGALFTGLDEVDDAFSASWWWLFGCGITILCGAGILGVPWAITIFALLLGRRGFRQSAFQSGRGALLVFVPVLTLLAVYFAWTLKEKVVPGQQPMLLSSIPFVFYEHLGFMGLGPGRAEMRSERISVFYSYAGYLCLLGAPLTYALWRAAAVRFGMERTRFPAVLGAALLPACLTFLLGIVRHFRVLGRHLTSLFPFILGALAFAIFNLWARRRLLDRVMACWLVGALLLSAVECRFAFRHARDDNKDAATIAKAALAKGEEVWWVADIDSALYYRLPISYENRPGMIHGLWNPTPTQLAARTAPDLILLSKPDLFDAGGSTREFIKTHGYLESGTMPAFSVWTR